MGAIAGAALVGRCPRAACSASSLSCAQAAAVKARASSSYFASVSAARVSGQGPRSIVRRNSSSTRANCASWALPGPAGTRTSKPSAPATISSPGYSGCHAATARCSAVARRALRAARLDPEPPPEAGRWTLLDAHARFGAGDRRAVGIATAGRLGEIPPRGEVGLDAAEPEGQLGVRGVGQHAVGDDGAQLGGKVGQPGDPSEQRARHRRRPSTRGDELEASVDGHAVRRGESLGLVHEMRGDVGQAVTLDADVEVPRRPAQRRAVHHLLQMVHAGEADGGAVGAGHELAEDGPLAHQAVGDARRDWRGVRSSSPSPARRHSARGARRQPRGAGEPGLVGEHVESGVVKPARQGHLAVVLPGEDHDVAGPVLAGARASGSSLVRTTVCHAVGRSVRRLKDSTSARNSASSRPPPGPSGGRRTPRSARARADGARAASARRGNARARETRVCASSPRPRADGGRTRAAGPVYRASAAA